MAAIDKVPVSPVSRLWTQTGSVLAPVFLDGSLVPITSAGVPEEIPDLSRLMLVVVLVPRSSIDDKSSAQQSSRNPCCLVPIHDSNEITSRLQAAMTRFHSPNAKDVFVFGEVALSFSTMEVCRMGEPVEMTCKEFKTLEYLIKNSRRVVTRDELLNQVWGYGCYPCTRTVDNHILKLRQKLELEPSEPRHFLTVRRVGYKFVP